MLLSCRFSIVGVHLLLLTHIAHSFVLLTANVEDVKKIARKFVSESLAEKIADFIARATETMTQKNKNSEENVNNADAQDSSQVSAENRMYNLERHGDDSKATEGKSKEDIVLGKVTVKATKNTFVEKKKHRFEEPRTTRKPRKEPKPLHGRSRYIVQTENKASLATEKALSKISEENYNKMQESIQLLENKLYSSTGGKPKNKKQKRKTKERAYKLLSGFASVENDASKDDTSDDKRTKGDELYNIRADDEKPLSIPTEEAATGIEKQDIEDEKQTEKAATDDAQREIKDDKNTEMVATNESLHVTGNDEFDHNENKLVQKTDKVASGARSFAAQTGDIEENWWEKEIPAKNHESKDNKGKSWF